MLTNNDTSTANQPSHLIYHVEEGSGSENFWTKIGAMWPHKDGKGYSMKLGFLPVNGDGTLSIRAYEPKAKETNEASDLQAPTT